MFGKINFLTHGFLCVAYFTIHYTVNICTCVIFSFELQDDISSKDLGVISLSKIHLICNFVSCESSSSGNGHYRTPVGVASIDISRQLQFIFTHHGPAAPQEVSELVCPFVQCNRGNALQYTSTRLLKRETECKENPRKSLQKILTDKLLVDLEVQFVDGTSTNGLNPLDEAINALEQDNDLGVHKK